MHRPLRPASGAFLAQGMAALALLLSGCDATTPAATPAIVPGTGAAPREVNIVARDYAYVPSTVDLVPGETVLLHVINGGLEMHEAILGSMDDQLAWEAAEEATVGHPPGPTPYLPDPQGFDGVRVVVGSGQRVDVTWTVPLTATDAAAGWFVGCHIPGHWAKGMVVPVRFVDRAGSPIAPAPPVPAISPGAPAVSRSPTAPSPSPSPAEPAAPGSPAQPAASGSPAG